MRPLVVVLLALAACGEDKIDVHATGAADYNHKALLQAVDAFVGKGRTADAYGELASTVTQLRPGMDRSVAREAELKLVVLALGPVRAAIGKPIRTQIDTLALTVWPTLLAPEIEADELLTRRDPKAATLLPAAGESVRDYVVRMCGGPLAGNCKQIVPEQQGAIVAAVATRRATERVRNAVADCVMCGADPAWHQAVRTWESLDRMTAATISDVSRRGDPDNWPVAGGAAEADPRLPEAELDPTGDVVIGGQHYGAADRIAALHDLRAGSSAIALHLRPEISLAQVRGILADARKAGASRVGVVAREPRYPWTRKLYWIADGTGNRTGLRSTDSLQLLLHATDAVATPGAIARVDG